MLTVKKITDYIIPTYGNRHCNPYGRLLVSDGTTEKVVAILGDREQYIVFNRKRYPVRRGGSLYSPTFEIVQEAEG